MNDYIDPLPPFEVGERIAPTSLFGWTYLGLTGIPDKPKSYRRYTKGMWVLELRARSNRNSFVQVLSIRTEAEDRQWWAQKARA